MEVYAANVIAESIFAQVDSKGYEHLLLDEIIDFRKDARILLRQSVGRLQPMVISILRRQQKVGNVVSSGKISLLVGYL